MESNGRSLNCWHHTDYNDQHKLQYLWDQLIKKLAYLALANKWGELNGRPRPPSIPPLGVSLLASATPPILVVDQTTEVVDPLTVTVEEAEIIAKAREEPLVIEEIGVIRDVDLANTIYTIPEVSEEHTPTLEFDSVKSDSGTDSDVSIEPYMAQGADYRAVEEVPSEPMQEQTGGTC